MTAVALAGSVIGMGNLEFPFFMLNWGFIPTMFFFLLSFWLMYYSCLMLIRAGDYT
jgi:amino acid permease